ncbi:hypothetical protein K450DRAFT_268849 [Umbelopsis ramanniana AG]|uniref:Protein Zds1 C-terminal domain-containing protein n=1 Tax=Umbelopsis ramanniana AG TaxID=1314678 RepID=A0AAD5EIG5_UMBRA|nr:uncharacterized protein K450DRAFT_268849 [Umbelopsis ramanniana AG]KAI8582910.1 hypothetical protein K450DRAFT_268849 [Umbelopsis ramanniana AG]
MDMRTDAQELSTQALNQASANLTDNNTIHDNHDQKSDENVDASSKKSDSGIYMEAKAEGHIPPISPVRTEDRDEQSATREHLSADYQDEATSYTEDSASIMSNTTTISSLMDEEDEGKQVYNIETTNPSRLFWVPAEQHPEIAPAEFANWLQTHGVIRGKGQLRVRRKRSILAVSYLPGEEDDDDEQSKEHSRQRRQTHSSTTSVPESQPFTSNVAEHPILEEQEETEPDSTVTTNNGRIRRTVSLYSPTSTVGRQPSTSSQTLIFDRHSSATDESPVIVPRVEGSLLRRAARTRIRRTSLSGSQPGEAGRRFGNRRSQSIHAKPSDYPERFGVVPPGGITLQDRPVSISEIIDFGGPEYEPAESQQGIITRVHDAETEVFSRIAAEENQQQAAKATKPDVTENAIPSHIQDENVIAETAEVIAPTTEHVNIPTTTQAPEEQLEVIIPTFTIEHKTQPDNQTVLKAKTNVTLAKTDSKSSKSSSSPSKPEKRSSWSFKFLSDDKPKKKQQQHLTSSSLQRVPSSSSTISTASNASSTGSSKSKLKDTNEIFSNPAKKLGLSHLFQRTNSKAQKANINGSSVMVKKSAKSNEINVANDDFSRFPVHVERAIYRLSHYKLSNPRRPLHHQVLISNLMFWYLSIINGQKIRQQASPQQSEHTASPESPPPSSFIIHSQNNYQEEQEATPAKLGKVGRFISASKKRRQEIIEKKQIQQQQHHQPRWLPPISEGSAQGDGQIEESDKTGTHVTFAAPKAAPRAKDVDERLPQTKSQPNLPHGSQLVTSKRPSDNRYSPIPNQHYQPSQQTTFTHEATTSESAPVNPLNPHPLPPIPGPPILSEVSSFDSFTDDILNSLGLEGQHASEDDDVPLALYRNRS